MLRWAGESCVEWGSVELRGGVLVRGLMLTSVGECGCEKLRVEVRVGLLR